MSFPKKVALPFLLAIGSYAAGCVEAPGKEIAILSSTPESIEIWGRNQIANAIGARLPGATDQQIADLAQSHCNEYGRNAFKISQHTDGGGDRIVVFHCVAGYEFSSAP